MSFKINFSLLLYYPFKYKKLEILNELQANLPEKNK